MTSDQGCVHDPYLRICEGLIGQDLMVMVRRRPVVMFQGFRRQLVLAVGDVSGFAVNCMQQAAYCTDISSLSETLIAHFMTVNAKVFTVAQQQQGGNICWS